MTIAPGSSPDLETAPRVESTMTAYEALTPEQAAALPAPEPTAWGAYTSPTPPPVKRRRRWPFALVGVVALAAIGVGALVVGNAAAKPITVVGALTVTDSDLGGEGANDICSGDDSGFEDISNGAEVVISSDTGKTLAITQLSDCVASDEINSAAFGFTATVPAGLGFYQIQVTHRGEVKFDESEMSAPMLKLGS